VRRVEPSQLSGETVNKILTMIRRCLAIPRNPFKTLSLRERAG
jgi:hypothetical protein